RQAEEGYAGGQDALRTVAVDKEAGGHLAEAGDGIEHRHREAELRVADAEVVADEGKERGQDELEEVAREMGRADETDDADVALRQGMRLLRHVSSALVAAQPFWKAGFWVH